MNGGRGSGNVLIPGGAAAYRELVPSLPKGARRRHRERGGGPEGYEAVVTGQDTAHAHHDAS